MRGPKDIRGGCPECLKASTTKNQIEVECAYCGKKFFKSPSKINNSKSGLHFCCREHKDLAQRIDSGDKFDSIRPSHYGNINNIKTEYRAYALKYYGEKCSVCGFDEDAALIEVHHIDEDRSNNTIENLIPLCALCHKKLTSHKYTLIDRQTIVKKE